MKENKKKKELQSKKKENEVAKKEKAKGSRIISKYLKFFF